MRHQDFWLVRLDSAGVYALPRRRLYVSHRVAAASLWVWTGLDSTRLCWCARTLIHLTTVGLTITQFSLFPSWFLCFISPHPHPTPTTLLVKLYPRMFSLRGTVARFCFMIVNRLHFAHSGRPEDDWSSLTERVGFRSETDGRVSAETRLVFLGLASVESGHEVRFLLG